ncbi:hypothetical protein AAY473_039991 [Plecturocebus cupreus]
MDPSIFSFLIEESNAFTETQLRAQSRVEELRFAATCCVPSQEPAPAFKELNSWEYGESYKDKLNLLCCPSVELPTQTNVLWTPKWPCPAPSASSSVAFIVLRAQAATALGSLDEHHGHHTHEIPRHSGTT